MRPFPENIRFVYPPITWPDGRKSIVAVPPPNVYVQSALTPQDLQDLSQEFNLAIPLIRAVVAVECAGSGFLLQEPPPARPKILFEAHLFYRLTPQPVSRSRPDLSSPQWNRSLYKGGSAEWNRLLDAMAFDPPNALKSASYGLGQVVGENFIAAGCKSVEQMVVESFAGEYWQARHMMNFIANNNLSDSLRQHDWATFAFHYNGPEHWRNNYVGKLEDAFRRVCVA